jgi:hypothetical protein
MVGRWESVCEEGCDYQGRFHYFFADGTFQGNPSEEAFERRLELAPPMDGYWFEGGRFYEQVEGSQGGYFRDPGCQLPGIYEIQLVDEGQAVFTVVEDECENRIEWYAGNSSEQMVWTRVE